MFENVSIEKIFLVNDSTHRGGEGCYGWVIPKLFEAIKPGLVLWVETNTLLSTTLSPWFRNYIGELEIVSVEGFVLSRFQAIFVLFALHPSPTRGTRKRFFVRRIPVLYPVAERGHLVASPPRY